MDSSFIKILRQLSERKVKYVLVGGIAANFHGSHFSTFDCDVVVDLETENLISLAEALSSLSPNFRHKKPPQLFNRASAALGGWKNIYLDTDAGVLDCLGNIKGLGDYQTCFLQSIEVPLGNFHIRVLTREALITAKKAMGRPKDLQTVAHLEVIGELEDK